jgi:hypothetical protein
MNLFHKIVEVLSHKAGEKFFENIEEKENSEKLKRVEEEQRVKAAIRTSVLSSSPEFFKLKQAYPFLAYEVCASLNRFDLVKELKQSYLEAIRKRDKEQKISNSLQKVGGVLIYLISFAGLVFLVYLIYMMIRDA